MNGKRCPLPVKGLGTKEDVMRRFKEYIDTFDYGIYAPFYHGTTRKRGDSILKRGLFTKSEAPPDIDLENVAWGAEPLRDRVYFAACNERYSIAEKACSRSAHYYYEEYVKGCAFIELVNYKKYVNFFALDEDSKGVPGRVENFFSEKEFTGSSTRLADALSVLEKMDRCLVKFYELGFVVGGGEIASKMASMTPQALFSIADYGTFAITTSIKPEDLREVSYDTYHNRESCRERIKSGIDSGAYYRYFRDHTPQGAAKFKEELVKGLLSL